MMIRALAVTIIAVAAASSAFAEQRALLVGVGKYAAPGNDLPGIDLDIQSMRDTLHVMGFEDAQIRSLVDQEATAENVKFMIGDWLTKGVKPTDRVIFYFSGHGSNIPDLDGDEPDGVDEVLVTHDVRRAIVEGRRTLTGVVRDDELFELISSIPSQNILTIVDACHSGTATRSFNLDDKSLTSDPVFVKSFIYDGMPEGDEAVIGRDLSDSETRNFVSISAADDNERAIGTSQGGVFTIGFTKAIENIARTGGTVTIQELRNQAAAYIEDRLDSHQVHHPQVTGSSTLANGALTIIPFADGNGPNRKRLIEMVQEQGNEFDLQATKSIYVVDDAVELQMKIPMNGYLNVVTVDSKDNAAVLFPNQYHLENSVESGTFSIPTLKMAFELPAAEPLGPTLIAAFVTQDPINFYHQTLDERDADGNVNVEFTTMSRMATRAIKVAPRKKEMYAVKLEIMVVAKP